MPTTTTTTPAAERPPGVRLVTVDINALSPIARAECETQVASHVRERAKYVRQMAQISEGHRGRIEDVEVTAVDATGTRRTTRMPWMVG